MYIEIKKERNSELLDLNYVRNWLRVDEYADNIIIGDIIINSLDIIEDYLNISIIDSTITIHMGNTYEFRLPYPVIEKINYVMDENGNNLSYTFNNGYININEFYDGDIDISYDTKKNEKLKFGWLETISYIYENRGDLQIKDYLKNNYNLKIYSNKLWI
jgi:hypothetical protein